MEHHLSHQIKRRRSLHLRSRPHRTLRRQQGLALRHQHEPSRASHGGAQDSAHLRNGGAEHCQHPGHVLPRQKQEHFHGVLAAVGAQHQVPRVHPLVADRAVLRRIDERQTDKVVYSSELLATKKHRVDDKNIIRINKLKELL
jgi:hypothetical protein